MGHFFMREQYPKRSTITLIIHSRVVSSCCCERMMNTFKHPCPWVFYIDHWSASLQVHVSFCYAVGLCCKQIFLLYSHNSKEHACIYYINTCMHSKNNAWTHNIVVRLVYAPCTNVGCKFCRSLSGGYFCPNPIDTRLFIYSGALAALSLRNISYD